MTRTDIFSLFNIDYLESLISWCRYKDSYWLPPCNANPGGRNCPVWIWIATILGFGTRKTRSPDEKNPFGIPFGQRECSMPD